MYYPIRIKSDHSVLFGFGTIDEYLKKAESMGINKLGVAERFSASSLYKFINKSKEKNIKVLPGVEFYIKEYDRLFFITLYALNNDGIKNIFKLVYKSFTNKENFSDKDSFLMLEQIKEHSEGLAVLTGYEGTLAEFFVKRKDSQIKSHLESLKDIFNDRVYVSVNNRDDFNLKVAKTFDVKPIPTHEVLFAEPEHKEACDLCMAVGTNSKMTETDTLHGGKRPVSKRINAFCNDTADGAHLVNDSFQLNDLDYEEFSYLYQNLEELIDSADVTFDFDTHLRPNFELPEGETEISHFKEIIKNGFLKKRKNTPYEEESKRKIKEELDTIWGNDYLGYFLVVEDYCRYAKENAGGIGAGRGCFLPNSMVKLSNGTEIPINEISVDSKVITYNGSEKRVLDRFKYYTEEKCLDLFLSNGRKISCTKDHKIYHKTKAYTPAEELEVGDTVLGPMSNDCHAEVIVERIEEFLYKGFVYDIEIEHVHNYVISDVVVHNSAGGSEIGYLIGIHDTDPIRHELLFERFLSPGRGSEYTLYYEDGTSEVFMVAEKFNIDGQRLYTHQLEPGMVVNGKRLTGVKLTRPSASSVDVDTDFHTEGRADVLNYVKEKYGETHVCNIATFIKFKALNSIKALCTVLDVPFSKANTISKVLPADTKLLKAMTNTGDLESMIVKHNFLAWTQELGDVGDTVFKYAPIIENRIKSESVHACGVLISSQELMGVIPTQISNKDGSIVSQWEYSDCESIGLIKMDFLGLDTVDIIENALKNVNENRNLNLTKEDLINSGLDDKKTYELFQKGYTSAIFQYSSDGVKKFLTDLKPDNFEDLYAVTALYRPGPMGMGAHESFARRKRGEEESIPFDNRKFLGTSVAKVLENTYELIPFQESLMTVARVCAGFTPYETDLLRKATAKKNQQLLASLKPKFLLGIKETCNKEIENNIDKLIEKGKIKNKGTALNKMLLTDSDLENMWKNLEAFAEYSFNKSHSVSYALNAYVAGYLKANYPEEFMASAISQQSNAKKKLVEYVEESRRLGIHIVPPDINISKQNTTSRIVNDVNKIYLGFDIIGGISSTTSDKIIDERTKNGPFKNFSDCISRFTDMGIMTKTIVENLARAGAFDSLGVTRKGVIESIEKIKKVSGKMKTGQTPKTMGLFANTMPVNDVPIPKEEYHYLDMAKIEYESCGFFITAKPMGKISFGDIENVSFNVTKEEMDKKPWSFKEFTVVEEKNGSNKVKTKAYPFLFYVSEVVIKNKKNGKTSISLVVDTGTESLVIYPGWRNGNKTSPLSSTGKLIQEGRIYKTWVMPSFNGNPTDFMSVADIEEVILNDDGTFKKLSPVPIVR